MRAGYCSECTANVWLDDEGACVQGHPASSIVGVYDVEAPAAPKPVSIRKDIPRWASLLWGLVLMVLNLFMVVYVAGFTVLFASVSGGSGGPSWLNSWFFDEQAFAGLFVVVVVAVLLSFGLMALSLLHIFAWSGLQIERKLVWAAVIVAGVQPGMLIYWFVNVWRREREPARTREPQDTAWRRLGVVLLGILTLIPPLYFVFFFLEVGGLAAGGGGESAALDYLPMAHLGVILLWWVLTAVYLVHVFRTPRLQGTTKAVWAAVVAFGGPIAWPVYWYMNMWRKAPQELSAG